MVDRAATLDKVSKLLFHLGKATWKSVPVIGNFVDELVYEQFKDVFLNSSNQLTDEKLAEFELKLGTNADDWDERLDSLVQGIQEFAHGQTQILLTCIENNHSKTRDALGSLPSMQLILEDIRKQTGKEDGIRHALTAVEERRREWANRISDTQCRLLDNIPESRFVGVRTTLLPNTKSLGIEPHLEKQLYLRLHELEWLGMVVRRKAKDGSWEYRRIGDRERMENHAK